MPSSFSTDLKLELMVTGENAGTWGDKTNTNLNLLQQAIAGYQAISIAGGAQTTALAMDNATISNARNAVVKLTGTITGNQVVTVPDGIEKTYIVSNGTVGAFTVEFKTASGTGPTFSTTDKGIKILFADGTNIVDVNANFSSSSFPEIKVPQINDSNGNEEIKFTTTASAVNELTIANAATGNGPEISATGSDTNIDLKITPKGTGKINLDGIKFPNADGSAGQALVTNGSGTLSFASAGLAWQSVQTTGFTAVKGNAYPCNTTSAAFTLTLPATPSAGDQVQLVDYAGTFDTNPLTINPNGEDIQGQTDNVVLRGEREGFILTYIDSTQGWLATSGISEGTGAFKIPIDFLVVAGGGGGGGNGAPNHASGGGGAGGFRTSTQLANKGTVITVTVGNGGAVNTPGSNSSISGTGLTTITSAGGGDGGTGADAASGTGANGGSGGGSGGGGAERPGGLGNIPSTAPNQGNNGGIGSSSGATGAGGGGGAETSGFNYGPSLGGNGGTGTASSITGSSVTRAGGGGGGAGYSPATGTGGTGGTGGGGNGSGTGNGTAGTTNTGGGGGGARGGSTSGAGGSGVVILSIPTSQYSSTTTGSPTVTTSGNNTILQFNGSGSYTA
jgi:hypothetical protein